MRRTIVLAILLVVDVESLRADLSVKMRGGTATNLRVGHRTCPFQVFIDDVAVPTPNLDNLSSKLLAGIEVYPGPATIPLQYKTTGGAFCGVILMWTRDGS